MTRCIAKTKAGKSCRCTAVSGESLCATHRKPMTVAEEAAKATERLAAVLADAEALYDSAVEEERTLYNLTWVTGGGHWRWMKEWECARDARERRERRVEAVREQLRLAREAVAH